MGLCFHREGMQQIVLSRSGMDKAKSVHTPLAVSEKMSVGIS